MESFILAATFIFIATVSFLMGMVWSKSKEDGKVSKEEFLDILEQEVKNLKLEAKDLVVKVKNKLNVK